MNTGGGGGGGLINFPPLKRGRLLERGGLNRGFTVRVFICNFVRIFVILNFSIKKINKMKDKDTKKLEKKNNHASSVIARF